MPGVKHARASPSIATSGLSCGRSWTPAVGTCCCASVEADFPVSELRAVLNGSIVTSAAAQALVAHSALRPTST